MIFQLENILFFLLVFVLGALFVVRAQKTQSFKPVIITAVILSIICGLRAANVGIDTPAYIYAIEHYGNANGINEPGFIYIVWLLMTLLSNVHAVLIVLSFFTIICFLRAIWNCITPNNFVSAYFCFYFFTYIKTFSGVRQWLAVAIAALAISIIISSKKKVKPILLFAIASTIHISALIALPIGIMIFVAQNDEKDRPRISKIAFYGGISLVALFVLYEYVTKVNPDFYALRKISNYSTELSHSDVSIGLVQILKLIVCLNALFFKRGTNYLVELNRNGSFQKSKLSIVVPYFSLVLVVFGFMGYYSTTISRVGWYLYLFDFMFYAETSKVNPRKTNIMSLLAFLIVIVIGIGDMCSKSFLYFDIL